MYTTKSKVTAEARGTVYIPNLLITGALLIMLIVAVIVCFKTDEWVLTKHW